MRINEIQKSTQHCYICGKEITQFGFYCNPKNKNQYETPHCGVVYYSQPYDVGGYHTCADCAQTFIDRSENKEEVQPLFDKRYK